MGFFDGLGRMIRGEPIFTDTSKGDERTAREDAPVEKSLLIDERGRKIIPEIRLEHCKSHISGDDMTVTVWATNMSTAEVELDRVEMLGVRRGIDRFLKPQEGHEIRLYEGRIPTSDVNHKAILQYKIVENGDYFAAEFMIEYNFESDGRYSVEELHPEPTIRDI